MRSMKRMPVVAVVTALVFVFAGAPVSASSKAPVKLGQKVTVKGTKDVSSKSSATLEEKLGDKYFNPTFIKAKAGEKITFQVKNKGSLPHTFTSDDLSIDKQINPGKSTKFTVTVPSDGAVFQFHCQYHETNGMVGAVYTKAGASASSSSSDSGTKSSSSSGTPGY
ncbi:MAG: cupredoxin domain-containing protein [Acidimicrobiia bacterium]